MKKSEKIKLLSLITILVLILSSCSAQGSELENGGTYLFVTGKSGGTYNTLGTAMAAVVDKYLNSTTTVISTDGSVDNIDILNKGDAEFAFCQSDIFYYAINGKEMFKDNPRKGLSVMAKLYSESVQIVVNASSDIETIGDLAGKCVAVGPYDSATEAAARQILEAYGVSYDDITVRYQTFADAASGLAGGSIDAAFAVSAMPSGNIADYADTHAIRFLPISTQVASKLKRTCPFFSDGVILSETYGTASSVSTLNIDILLICRNDLADTSVYSITKTLFDNLDELGSSHSYGNDIYVETAYDLDFGNYHEGAARYYKDIEYSDESSEDDGAASDDDLTYKSAVSESGVSEDVSESETESPGGPADESSSVSQ